MFGDNRADASDADDGNNLVARYLAHVVESQSQDTAVKHVVNFFFRQRATPKFFVRRRYRFAEFLRFNHGGRLINRAVFVRLPKARLVIGLRQDNRGVKNFRTFGAKIFHEINFVAVVRARKPNVALRKRMRVHVNHRVNVDSPVEFQKSFAQKFARNSQRGDGLILIIFGVDEINIRDGNHAKIFRHVFFAEQAGVIFATQVRKQARTQSAEVLILELDDDFECAIFFVTVRQVNHSRQKVNRRADASTRRHKA